MSLPSSIQVGPVRYRVTADPTEFIRCEHDNQMSGSYGHTDHLSATILLSPDTVESVTRLTLLHEVMHAATESMMGARDWVNLGDDRSSREETVIRAWEAPFLSVLRDNPDLVAYLTAAD